LNNQQIFDDEDTRVIHL